MGIKETPTNFRVYYKSFKDEYTKLKEETIVKLEEFKSRNKRLYDVVSNCKDLYLNNYNINLDEYPEFTNNKYIDGRFHKVAKGAFINRSGNYEVIADLYDLFELANSITNIYNCETEIAKYESFIKLTLKEYTEILSKYYTEVHKRLILHGEGYSFGYSIGWIMINRCVLVNPRPHLDWKATKQRKQELLNEGKQLYDKNSAEWCKKNGIEYNPEEYRVYAKNEYCYEIPLISCKLNEGSKYKFTVTDYRHASIRGKTNDDLVKECNSDLIKICELPVDLRTKLNICDKINKHLYIKFVRNENQQPIATPKANRKN